MIDLISKRMDDWYAQIDEKIDFLYSYIFMICERFLDLPRGYELVTLINRIRKII